MRNMIDLCAALDTLRQNLVVYNVVASWFDKEGKREMKNVKHE